MPILDFWGPYAKLCLESHSWRALEKQYLFRGSGFVLFYLLLFFCLMQETVRSSRYMCHESGCHSLQLHITHGLHLPSSTAPTHSITPITQLSPFTHQPWLFHHTCTSFTHTHISSSLPCTHGEVLFCPGWHSERFPCFLIPCVYLDCLFTLTICCLPFWPCLPVDICSVCCLPRPLHCPCCWFCLAFIIPVTAFWPLPVWPLVWNKAAIGSNLTAIWFDWLFT